jgi:exonuclease SbcC
MHVFIKDYQILKNIELDFKPGLNVITGPSNNGKSSIIKAIKAAIYTETGSTPIRFGCDFYLVQIKNNNHSVLFQKKQTTATYVVDKETYSKFGTNTPI